MHIFSCKVVAAKFQSLLDNFYNNLTVKNSLHYIIVVRYLETEEILCIVVLNFKCSANIILYAILCDIHFTKFAENSKLLRVFEVHETT